jgi:hypothetical protein
MVSSSNIASPRGEVGIVAWMSFIHTIVVPAKAGIQSQRQFAWIPAFAGTTIVWRYWVVVTTKVIHATMPAKSAGASCFRLRM